MRNCSPALATGMLLAFASCSSDDSPLPATMDAPSSTTDTAATEADGPARAEGPAAGCGQGGEAGDFAWSLDGTDAEYRITLPPNYDPNQPVPLVFAFHGRNRTHIELQEIDAARIQTDIGGQAIVAYLKSQNGNGWNFAEEVEPNVEFFQGVYEQMLANYCVDTGRVYAIGHSSGGYFSNILGCRFSDQIRGVGSVAGAQQETDCEGTVPAIVVHGVRDSVVSFESGQQSRDHYLGNNGCGETNSPAGVSPCMRYEGCDTDAPVQWCEHNEPTYEDTNHGWPSFASEAIASFLFALPG